MGQAEVRGYICKGNLPHEPPSFGNSKIVGLNFLDAGPEVERWDWLNWSMLRLVIESRELKRKLMYWEKRVRLWNQKP